jgi:hypothetical protein
VFRAGFLGFQMRYQGLKLGDPAGRSIDRSLFSGRVVGTGCRSSVVIDSMGLFLKVFSKVI